MPTLLLATNNPGKVAELRALLSLYVDVPDLRLLTPGDLSRSMPSVDETGATFAENAWLKARALADASGLAALADDSGLCVDALGGAPGVQSARWAGPTDADRTTALLRRLVGVPLAERTARFACAVCVATPTGGLAEAEGICEGIITDEPRGTHGFGYDPIFLLQPQGRTLAELSAQDKNGVSHRARAVAILAPSLLRMLSTTR